MELSTELSLSNASISMLVDFVGKSVVDVCVGNSVDNSGLIEKSEVSAIVVVVGRLVEIVSVVVVGTSGVEVPEGMVDEAGGKVVVVGSSSSVVDSTSS